VSPYGEGGVSRYIRLVYDVDSTWQDVHAGCNEYATDPIRSFTEFPWYLLVEIDFRDIGLGDQNASNGIQAWEAYVSISDEITVIREVVQPPGSLNVGIRPPREVNDSNWIVVTGTLIPADSTPFVLVEYTGLLLSDATDLHVDLAGAEPSSFTGTGGPGPVPGWVEFHPTGECDNECLRPFARWDHCTGLTVNTTHPYGCECVCICDPVSPTSWGALKARF